MVLRIGNTVENIGTDKNHFVAPYLIVQLIGNGRAVANMGFFGGFANLASKASGVPQLAARWGKFSPKPPAHQSRVAGLVTP